MIRVVALDADDTLWHNETHFFEAQARFRDLLSPFHEPAWIEAQLHATELRNLHRFGYGIKGFTLSMVETAIELTEGRIPGSEIQRIIDLGKDMLAKPVEPLPHVLEALSVLAGRTQLMVITKGDLFDQEAKLARSGLGHLITRFEVVSEKDEDTYRKVLEKWAIAPEEFLMVGNSVRSDILPVLALGAQAIHIPYALTWVHERVQEQGPQAFPVLEHLGQVADWLLNSAAAG